jgi:hypothetical protein
MHVPPARGKQAADTGSDKVAMSLDGASDMAGAATAVNAAAANAKTDSARLAILTCWALAPYALSQPEISTVYRQRITPNLRLLFLLILFCFRILQAARGPIRCKFGQREQVWS